MSTSPERQRAGFFVRSSNLDHSEKSEFEYDLEMSARDSSSGDGLEEIHLVPMDPSEVKLLREQSWSDRLRISGELFFAARNMIAASVRANNPEWDEVAVMREAARRMLNDYDSH